MLDLAHQIDLDFANSIVSSLDNGTSENDKILERYSKELKKIKLKEKLKKDDDNNSEKFKDLSYSEAMDVAKVSWESYAHLKANTIIAKKPNVFFDHLSIGSRLSFDDSFPIYAMFIENIIKRKSVKNKQSYYEATYIACRFALINKDFNDSTLLEIQEGHERVSDTIAITFGMEQEALQFISEKLNDSTLDQIILVDQYFSKKDLTFVYELYRELEVDELEFYILTSDKSIRNEDSDNSTDYSALFLDYWKENISEERPPIINVYIVNERQTNASPFHDRYLIGNNVGMILGGSINGLGKAKEINITTISEETRISREEHFTNYITSNYKFFRQNNLDVSIKSFSL